MHKIQRAYTNLVCRECEVAICSREIPDRQSDAARMCIHKISISVLPQVHAKIKSTAP